MTKKFWVEITKEEHGHGGNGWEYGHYLWSPVVDNQGKKIYENMKGPQKDDIVVHFYKTLDNVTYLHGESIIAGVYSIVNTNPPLPGPWDNRGSYFRIPLKAFKQFQITGRGKRVRTVLDFVAANNVLIANERLAINKFYPFDKNNKLNEGKYLCEITQAVYNVI